MATQNITYFVIRLSTRIAIRKFKSNCRVVACNSSCSRRRLSRRLFSLEFTKTFRASRVVFLANSLVSQLRWPNKKERPHLEGKERSRLFLCFKRCRPEMWSEQGQTAARTVDRGLSVREADRSSSRSRWQFSRRASLRKRLRREAPCSVRVEHVDVQIVDEFERLLLQVLVEFQLGARSLSACSS